MRNYNSKYVVRLTAQEREELCAVLSRGKVAAGKRRRAQVLLKADATIESSGPTDADVAEALDVSAITVHRTRKAYVEQGLSAAIEGKPNAGHPPRKLDGAKEAVLIATACSPPPAGKARWTLRMLADKLVELQVVDAIGKDCVADVLKKTRSSRG
jgi:transposase